MGPFVGAGAFLWDVSDIAMSTFLKRGLLWALAGSFALVGACFGGIILWAAVGTAAPADRADSFLALLAEGNTHEAYAAASSSLHSQQEEQVFAEIIGDVGLVGYDVPSFFDRRLPRRGRASVEATIQTGSGRDILAIVDLIREGDDWRVRSFTDARRAGVGPGAWFWQPPGDAGLSRLAEQTLEDVRSLFDEGRFFELNGKLFSAFRSFDNPTFLEHKYRPFIDPEISLPILLMSEVEIETPPPLRRIGYGDILTVPGRFNVEPSPVPFRYLYIYRHPDWKLFAVQIRESFEGLPF